MMSIKTFLITGALAFTITGIASAKSYHFTLTAPAAAGPNQLKAGDYDVKLQGTQVVLTDEARGKSVSVPVTVEHNDKKFDDTAVEVTNTSGKENIHSIDLGGSNTRIVLSQ